MILKIYRAFQKILIKMKTIIFYQLKKQNKILNNLPNKKKKIHQEKLIKALEIKKFLHSN